MIGARVHEIGNRKNVKNLVLRLFAGYHQDSIGCP
jgi:hypothetical protein